MQSSGFGLIKQVTQPVTHQVVPASPAAAQVQSPAPAEFRPGRVAAGEFLRMAGVAALSGLVFSLVAGLLVFLVASHGAMDPGSPQEEGSQISQRP